MSERQSLPNMDIVWLLQFLRNLCSVLELTAIHDFALTRGTVGQLHPQIPWIELAFWN